MKTYKFLDNSIISVSDNMCRGCFLEHAENLPPELEPIWGNSFFVIRQDAECPIPGFYIVSTRQHINTIGNLESERASELGIILNRLRYAMLYTLKVKRIHIFLEERMIDPHLHIWMLPLWPHIMEEHHIDPKIWNSNIYEYISLFTYKKNRDTILYVNEMMKESLRNDPILVHYHEK